MKLNAKICGDDVGKASRKTGTWTEPASASEHSGEYPDTMPQAIKLIDAEGRSCIYVPITQDGKVVDSYGFLYDPEDE